MKIITYNLQFYELKERKCTRRIIIHHSDSPDVAVTEIHRWHLARDWSGVGYHFVIRKNGSIEEGRPLNNIGAHAGIKGNSDSIGICLTGNFMEAAPSAAQLDSLVELINYLRTSYNQELAVIGHKDVTPTDCPGIYFPWDELNNRLKQKEVHAMPQDWKTDIMDNALKERLITADHQPDEPASKWFVLAVALNLLKRLEVSTHED